MGSERGQEFHTSIVTLRQLRVQPAASPRYIHSVAAVEASSSWTGDFLDDYT